MQNASGGYTLIEVMLFLAISSVILALSIMVVGGQSAHTEFVSSMNDVNTKMQQWIDEVDNGFSNNTSVASQASSNFDCIIDSSTDSPKLVTGSVGSARGANPDCVFLGRAIQVSDSEDSDHNNHIYAYTVIGKRTYTNAGQTIGVDNIVNANPVAAYFPSPNPSNNIDLTEDFLIPNGARVMKVTSSGGGGTTSHMAGFFTSFNTQDASQQNGSTSLLALQYPLSTNYLPKEEGVQNCITLKANPCRYAGPAVTNPWPMTNWKICFASTRNDDIAWLSVTSSGGFGAQTQLTYSKGTC